mmetsp:Transcript_83571/g.132084  ORF Transcript_83571/g.132084 Transcript_83571/m.132084 type:complete len:212 (+) Transcript_83571:1217-1852(+)
MLFASLRPRVEAYIHQSLSGVRHHTYRLCCSSLICLPLPLNVLDPTPPCCEDLCLQSLAGIRNNACSSLGAGLLSFLFLATLLGEPIPDSENLSTERQATIRDQSRCSRMVLLFLFPGHLSECPSLKAGFGQSFIFALKLFFQLLYRSLPTCHRTSSSHSALFLKTFRRSFEGSSFAPLVIIHPFFQHFHNQSHPFVRDRFHCAFHRFVLG